MAGFNGKMQSLRHEYLQRYLKRDMRAYWNRYQRKRMHETYLPQYRNSCNKKKWYVVMAELLKLQMYWKCFPYHYFRYGLFEESFSFPKVLEYLPETIFYYSILPQINTEYILLDDKSICYDILKAHNLPIPTNYFYTNNGRIYDESDRAIKNEKDFINCLRQLPDDSLVVGKKTQCGSGGHDVVFFHKKDNKLIWDNHEMTYEGLTEEFDNWLFQENISNAKPIRDLYPYALNTFRIFSYYNQKEVNIVYVMLKLGNNYSRTDNAHTGGMYVNVDIESGRLSRYAYDEAFNKFEKHPLTGMPFGGMLIPHFNEVLDVVRKAASLFPYLKCVGWDVALTDKGPVVIEGNSSPGLTIIQRTNFGMKRFLDLYYGNTEDSAQ